VTPDGQEDPHDRHQRERVGVAGDPTPDHEYGDTAESVHDLADEAPPWTQRVTGDVVRLVDELTDAGLLTERQALVYVLRDVKGLDPDDTAADVGIGTSAMYDHLAAARSKLSAARSTLDTFGQLDQPPALVQADD